MNNRTYRIAVILSVFALIGVAGAGAVAAQDAVNSASPETPIELGESSDVDVNIDVGGNASEHEIIVTAEGGPQSPVQTTVGPINTTPLQGQTGVTQTVTLGPFNQAGTYDVNATLVNVTASTTTEITNNSALTVPEPATNTKGERERNAFDSPGDGTVVLGPSGDRPSVFQGETSIAFYDADNNEFVDELTSTDDENRVIDVPIGTNEQPGTYTINGSDSSDGVVVKQPEVTTLEAVNVNGEDVSSVTQNNNIAIGVNFNYNVSEPLDPEFLDDSGVDVTGQYRLAGGPAGTTGFTEAKGDLNTAQNTTVENEGYDYLISANFNDAGQFEIVAQPEEDLEDIDSATQTEVLDVASDDDPELELEQDSASQGEEVDAEITNVEDGDTYYVAVRADDRRDENTDAGNFTNPFVNAGDTEDTGLVNGNYFAEVEADGTSGLTRLDTEFLDDTSIDVYLYGDGTPGAAGVVGDTDFEQDDVSLEVSQAQITIDSPGQNYVPGQEVDLNGTVSEGVEDVAVFVRDRDNYFHIANISVDDDDNTYEETDVVISDSNDVSTRDAADIVGQPGVYRYGVIDVQDVLSAENDPDSETDAPFVGTNAVADAGLTSSDFSSGASVQQSLRVAEPSLEGAIETYDGEVFADDDVDVTGTLIGPREFVTLFTDSRGNTEVNTFNADRDDGEIDEEDITINTLSTGNVRGSILSPGRDTEFGDGTFTVNSELAERLANDGVADFQSDTNLDPANQSARTSVNADVDNFVAIANGLGAQSDNTQTQITEILLDETVEEAGSDDLIVAEEFRLRDDSSTQIEDVVPEQIADNATGVTGIEVGETMVIRGVTNRNPDDATIVVEATEGPSLAELGTAVTDEWGYDGVWNVSIEVPEDVEPGQYTIQSDDGDRISEANVTIAAEGTYEEGERAGNQLGELQNQIEELQTQVDNLESERDDLEQQVSDLESENSELETQLEEAQSSDTGGNDTQDNGTDDGQGQPGFTAVAALISLIAVALLAIRRQEE